MRWGEMRIIGCERVRTVPGGAMLLAVHSRECRQRVDWMEAPVEGAQAGTHASR
jgi:hypothetical protein